MHPNSDILQDIFGGDHIKNILSTVGWGTEVLYSLVFLVSLVALFISIAKLAKSSGNAVQRSHAFWGILVSGICIAILGSLGLVYLVFIGFI